jgi:hypothetical protein
MLLPHNKSSNKREIPVAGVFAIPCPRKIQCRNIVYWRLRPLLDPGCDLGTALAAFVVLGDRRPRASHLPPGERIDFGETRIRSILYDGNC